MERLQKVLARAGLGSRRVCEALIVAGRVTVDGAPAALGQRVDPAAQRIQVDGQPLAAAQAVVYLMLHKPRGVVTTAHDPQGRRTVLDLLGPQPQRLYPVGRLDYDSEGLVLLTNDGPLAHGLLHPSRHVPRVYQVDLEPGLQQWQRLRAGVWLEDGLTAPCEVELLRSGAAGLRLRLTLYEGRNRQIRRMVAALGGTVKRLVRVAMGPLRLGDLPAGRWRPLTRHEVMCLNGNNPAIDS